MTCSRCKYTNPGGARYCGKCGQAMPQVSVELDVKTAVLDALPTVRHDNALAVWKKLHSQFSGQALAALAELVSDPTEKKVNQLHALWLLQHGVNSREGRASVGSLLKAAAMLVDGPPVIDGFEASSAALRFIVQAPVTTRQKWEVLIQQLESASPDPAARVLYELKSLIPPDKKAETARAVLELLPRLQSSIGDIAEVLRTTDYREAIPVLRDTLSFANLDASAVIASLLMEWQDTGAASVIRLAIENHRMASSGALANLTAALLQIEGASCGGYLSEVLRDAAPFSQTHMLREFRLKGDSRYVAVARQILETTDNQELKKAAVEFLGRPS